MRLIAATLSCAILSVFPASFALAQTPDTAVEVASAASLPDAPTPQTGSGSSAQQGQNQPVQDQPPLPPQDNKDSKKPNAPGQQPKRILGIMPNYRAVSAGAIPPPATPRQAFKIATQNSFDYSSFIFVGLTSMIAEGEDDHPQLGKGVPGFWAYSWRGFLDKVDGNYWVVFVLPSALHEDERYYAKGTGRVWKRAVYASSRVLITPNYQGHNTINGAELLGRGVAQGISLSYYPSSDRTASALAAKYGYAILRDASTNTFREFWPDIAQHVLHRHP
ncbi:MAG TPA: hypothetical protein VHX20_09050 [Terracidiphilus sp.]|jgi:hypothetical protein|nr:hypothetical protein [Terracidiphilus sp.]